MVKYVQYFVLFFVVINHIDSTKDVHRYWIAVVLTAVIVGTVGLAQIPSGARVTAPFEGTQSEPNTFAGYLAFVFLICLAMALGLPQHRHRIIYFFVACYLLVPFLFTLSRAAYIAMVPGLVVVMILSRRRLASYVLAAVGLSLVLFPTIFPEIVRERVAFTWTQSARRGQGTFLGYQLDTSTTGSLGKF